LVGINTKKHIFIFLKNI